MTGNRVWSMGPVNDTNASLAYARQTFPRVSLPVVGARVLFKSTT